jgi:hypothetical protein
VKGQIPALSVVDGWVQEAKARRSPAAAPAAGWWRVAGWCRSVIWRRPANRIQGRLRQVRERSYVAEAQRVDLDFEVAVDVELCPPRW